MNTRVKEETKMIKLCTLYILSFKSHSKYYSVYDFCKRGVLKEVIANKSG